MKDGWDDASVVYVTVYTKNCILLQSRAETTTHLSRADLHTEIMPTMLLIISNAKLPMLELMLLLKRILPLSLLILIPAPVTA